MSSNSNKMSLLVAALAGASCQPLIHGLVIQGYVSVAILVIAVLGAAAGMLGMGLSEDKRGRRIGLLVATFGASALISGLVSFSHYYWTDGFADPKLSVGIALSLLYFVVIALVGGLAMLIAALLQRRKESRATLSTPL